MARRVRASTGVKGLVLPGGWVLDDGDEVVLSTEEWIQIKEDAETLGRLDNLGFTSDTPDPVPSYRDMQRAVAEGDIGLEGQIDDLDTALAAHLADIADVHGIPDTSVLETVNGAQTKADSAEAEAKTYTNAHAGDTTNVHGIADTSLLLVDDFPSMTTIFENGLA